MEVQKIMQTMKSPVQSTDGPLVTWLLCTHRSDALLRRAIDSCLSQTMADFELLIVVNGPDFSLILEELEAEYGYDSRVRVIGTPMHLLNFSLSLGLHHARAPLVARMDADDESHPDRLEKQVEFMMAHKNVAVLGSSYDLIGLDGSSHGHVSVPEKNADIRRELIFRNPICHPSVMLRRAPVLAVGGYLGGRNAEDYDLWVRMSMTDLEFHNLPEALLKYNASPDGVARGSRTAYGNVAGVQFRQFVLTGGLMWLVGSVMNMSKAFFFSRRE